MKRVGVMLMLAWPLFAQMYRVDPASVMTIPGVSPSGGMSPIYTVSDATIKLCLDYACTVAAQTYTDATGMVPCSSNAQVVWAGTSVCTSTTDKLGNFGFWVAVGTYYYTVTLRGGTKYGPFALPNIITLPNFQLPLTGTIPRTYQSKVSETVSVLDFGAVGDGLTDDTAAFRAALNSGAKIVVVPQPPTYYATTAPLKIPHGVALRGNMRSGMIGNYVEPAPSIVKVTNATVGIPRWEDSVVVQRDCIFYMDPLWFSPGSGGSSAGYYPQNFEISGLSIRGAGSSLVEYGIYFETGSGLLVQDVDLSGMKEGLYLRYPYISRFERVKAAARITVETATSLTFIDCSSGGSSYGFDGFHLNFMLYSSLINCTSDNAHESSYTFVSDRSLTLIGVGSENSESLSANESPAFNFKASNNVTMIGCHHVFKNGSTKPSISTGLADQIEVINGYYGNIFGNQSGAPLGYDLYAGADSTVHFQGAILQNSTTGSFGAGEDHADIHWDLAGVPPVVTVDYAGQHKVKGATGDFDYYINLGLDFRPPNGSNFMQGRRATDTSPTGTFFVFQTSTGDNLLYSDIDGSLHTTYVAPVYASVGSNGPMASQGFVRLTKADTLQFRNETDTGDVLGISKALGTDMIEVGGAGGVVVQGMHALSGETGLTQAIHIKDNAGANCTVTFKYGLMVATDCP